MATAAKDGFWRNPQRVWLRRALFQIHLWVGILLCLYAVVIGISGSALVFEKELAQLSYPQLLGTSKTAEARPATASSMAHVKEVVGKTYPSWHLLSIYAPGVRGGNYYAIVSRNQKYKYIFASAATLGILGDLDLEASWLNWLADLHFRLLGGSAGWIANGIGAACLLILCVTGAVIWWPGVRSWRRALTVDFRRRWIRINFDLHSAIGFWTLAIMSIWAISGIYLIWPQAFVSFTKLLSKTGNAEPPKLQAQTSGSTLALDALIEDARSVEPRAKLQGIAEAAGDQPCSVMLARGELDDFSHTTYVYLQPGTGARLGVWRVGDNKTFGDWFIWSLTPLHFGTYWGMGVKILWALLGVLLPALSVTGVLMYWNRYLRKKWRALTESRTPSYLGERSESR